MIDLNRGKKTGQKVRREVVNLLRREVVNLSVLSTKAKPLIAAIKAIKSNFFFII